MNLVEFAKMELHKMITSDDEGDQAMAKHLLHMVGEFAKEGHSGFSASYALSVLKRLLDYEPLSPLTGEPDEWNEIDGHGDEIKFQNRRCSRVFMNGEGLAYDVEAKVFEDQKGGRFTGNLSDDRYGSLSSAGIVEFPYTPARTVVKVIETEEGVWKLVRE